MNPVALELVVAVAANGVIGRGGELPWRLPDDLRHFKSLTLGHAVIMGRRTFESIGRALPGRKTIVVSSGMADNRADGIAIARSLDDAQRLAADSAPPAFVIGGAALYALAIPQVRAMHLTELDEPVDGDTYFPRWDKSEWELTSSQRHERDAQHAIAFRICTYVRKAVAR